MIIDRHHSINGGKKIILIGVAICAIVTTVALSWTWIETQIQIDSCLDLGGKWDYSANKCIGPEDDH